MPKIPFDIDRDFGRAKRVAASSSGAAAKVLVVLFMIGAAAVAYSVLRNGGLI